MKQELQKLKKRQETKNNDSPRTGQLNEKEQVWAQLMRGQEN